MLIDGCEDKIGSTDLASWSDENETQTVGEDDEELQNAQDNYDYQDEIDNSNIVIEEDTEGQSTDNNVIIEEDAEDESDDNSVIVEDDTDEFFGTGDSDYHDISNNENIQKFSSVMLPPMKSTICYRSVRDHGNGEQYISSVEMGKPQESTKLTQY